MRCFLCPPPPCTLFATPRAACTVSCMFAPNSLVCAGACTTVPRVITRGTVVHALAQTIPTSVHLHDCAPLCSLLILVTTQKALCALFYFPCCLAKCPYLRMPFVCACPARDSLRMHLPCASCPLFSEVVIAVCAKILSLYPMVLLSLPSVQPSLSPPFPGLRTWGGVIPSTRVICVPACVFACARVACVCLCAFVCVRASLFWCVCVRVCLLACVPARVRVRVCVRMRVRMPFVCLHARMRVCVYVRACV